MAITEEMIADWKEKYKRVYRIPLTGTDVNVYIRQINREEYMKILQDNYLGVEVDGESAVCKLCISNEYPEELFSERSGLVSAVHEKIMEKSGFVNVECKEL